MAKRARNTASAVGRWGGTRAGAGRPPSGARASERHKTRPAIAPTHAVHVIARVGIAIRSHEARSAIAHALDLSLARSDFRIVHLGVRLRARDAQLELIAFARDRLALARGMQGFQVSAARGLNRAARRTGSVFPDRYRARILPTRAAMRRAIAGIVGV